MTPHVLTHDVLLVDNDTRTKSKIQNGTSVANFQSGLGKEMYVRVGQNNTFILSDNDCPTIFVPFGQPLDLFIFIFFLGFGPNLSFSHSFAHAAYNSIAMHCHTLSSTPTYKSNYWLNHKNLCVKMLIVNFFFLKTRCLLSKK